MIFFRRPVLRPDLFGFIARHKMNNSRLPILSRKLLQFPGFRVFRARIRPGEFPTNTGGELRIIATLGGEWELQPDPGQTIRYSHGEICLLPASLHRRARFRVPGDNLFISVETSLLERLAEETGEPTALLALKLQTLNDPFIYETTNALAREIGLDGQRGFIYTESLVLGLLGYLLRGGMGVLQTERAEGGLPSQKLRACEKFMDAHLGDDLRVEDIAAAIDISAFHFSRAFKKSTGKTPHRYLTEKRISFAQKLVVYTDRSLSQISRDVGFCSPSHFSTVFHAVTGSTPSTLRRR